MVVTLDHVTQRLWKRLPMAAAMGVEVVEYAAGGVRLAAPLENNLNYHQTAFGGSIATLGILAGWMLLNLELNGDADDCAADKLIVIQESRTDYLRPIKARFEAVCRRPAGDEWGRFLEMIERKGAGRVVLVAEMWCAEKLCARETGLYVASVRGR